MEEPVPRRPGSPASQHAGALARARLALRRLGCTPAEALALAVLAAAAVAALGLWTVAIHGGLGAQGSAPTPVTATPAGEGLQIHTEAPAPLVVHVAGRVSSPGVYQLPDGARVAEALAAAGGTLEDAALETLNLARPLGDGEQVLVRARGDPPVHTVPGAPVGDGPSPSALGAGGLLDLNRASPADLETLPGVGPVLAGRIVEHRDRLGGRFEEVGQLRDVPGIGETRFQAIAELVTL